MSEYHFDIDAEAGPVPVAEAHHELINGPSGDALQVGVQLHEAPPSLNPTTFRHQTMNAKQQAQRNRAAGGG